MRAHSGMSHAIHHTLGHHLGQWIVKIFFGCRHHNRTWVFGKWREPKYQYCLDCGKKLPVTWWDVE